MDDVIFAHKPRLLDVAAQLKRSARAGIPLADQRTLGTTFRALKVTFQVATPGAELRSVTALLTFHFDSIY